MRSTFKLLFYINRNKVKSDGTTAVLCGSALTARSQPLPPASIAGRRTGTARSVRSEQSGKTTASPASVTSWKRHTIIC